ncbi:MAG TPA: PIN domain-containing protein [Spirochaetota bacterium]|nr:PIN domain-containing protein [Spirochaetota bacterium]
MNLVLIDSSVWIAYFRGIKTARINEFENLIDNNQICVNDLILSELLPSLYQRKESEIIDILKSVRKIPLEINWDEIIEFQRINLKSGINNVGIPDLIIVQNVIQNGISLFTIDNHFHIMSKHHKFKLY